MTGLCVGAEILATEDDDFLNERLNQENNGRERSITAGEGV
jgi:hypothetical protein